MRYLLIVAAALGAAVLIVLIVGWSLPVKHSATSEATFKSSPESLYQLITDFDRFPEWRSSVTRVEHLPDSAGKKRIREVGSDGPIVYEIESAVPERRLVTRIADRSLPFGGSWTYELIPRGDSTTLRITEDGEVYKPLFRFVSRFVIGHTSTMEKYLADVRRHVETAGHPG
ncbi:MAG TPA: SRPBCC family protein [Gemmatimonadaceae bacterium]|nr:SRPBCC family protein [Gemmatimonadaceae bacterium]